MRQIAGTFESAGVTPMFHRGAAQVYSHLAATPLAEGAPEAMDGSLSPRRAAAVYAESLPMKAEEG